MSLIICLKLRHVQLRTCFPIEAWLGWYEGCNVNIKKLTRKLLRQRLIVVWSFVVFLRLQHQIFQCYQNQLLLSRPSSVSGTASSLEDQHNSATATWISNLNYLFCQPLVVFLDHANIAKVHGVLAMHIEASTNKDNVRIKIAVRDGGKMSYASLNDWLLCWSDSVLQLGCSENKFLFTAAS